MNEDSFVFVELVDKMLSCFEKKKKSLLVWFGLVGWEK